MSIVVRNAEAAAFRRKRAERCAVWIVEKSPIALGKYGLRIKNEDENSKGSFEMTKDEEYDLRKAFTFENFKKLLYFVNCCAGEGLQLGKVCADELEYDILAEVSEDVWETIDKEANQFLGFDND